MKVSVKNYGIVRKADIEFLSGLNVIRGESGSGKSTVLRGIEGAIFNTSGDSVITQGECAAEIKIDYSGHELKRIRNTKSSFKTMYTIDGDTIQKVGQTPVQKVLDTFGIKEIKAGGVSLRPNFLPQFAKPFLIDESPSKIFEFLTVTQNAVNLKDVESAITDDLKELQVQRKSKEETVNSLKKMILTSSQILEHEKEIFNLNEALNKFNKKEERISRLDELLSKIRNKQNIVGIMSKKIEALESVLSNIEKLNFNYEMLDEYLRKISLLDTVLKKMYSLKDTSEKISLILEKTKDNYMSEETKEKINDKIKRYTLLEQQIYDITNKKEVFERVDHTGREIKKEKLNIDKEIQEFYMNNVPLVIMNTNDDLCSSLKVTKETVVNVLNTKWLSE